MEYADGRSIGEIVERRRNIILKGADALSAKGYTMVPNHVLVSDKVSPGAKLAYAMLLKCIPPATAAWTRREIGGQSATC